MGNVLVGILGMMVGGSLLLCQRVTDLLRPRSSAMRPHA